MVESNGQTAASEKLDKKLEAGYTKGGTKVLQPRRVATMPAADRAADKMGTKQDTRFASRVAQVTKTAPKYTTDGTLLREFYRGRSRRLFMSH